MPEARVTTRTLTVIFLTLMLLIVQIPLGYADSNYEKKPLSGVNVTRILVAPRAGISDQAIYELAKQQGITILQKSKRLGVFKASVADANVDVAIANLSASGLIKYAEQDYKRKAASFTPNDPLYPDQWGLKQIGMEDAWTKVSASASTINIALLDTGVDLQHEDLQNVLAQNPNDPSQILGRHFFTDNSGKQIYDSAVQDYAGHGTHIAGIIAAQVNNGIGVAGVAMSAKLMPIKVLDDVGYGDDSNIAEGLVWAADNGARVVNMSLSGPEQSRTLARAVKYAHDKGVVVVAATGNEGVEVPNYPAGYPGVIGVGATDNQDKWMPQSNYGSDVDVVAPGVSILSTFPPAESYDGTPYESHTGTSMAAAFVSGLAGLLLANNPNLTSDQVDGMIFVSADDFGVPGWDPHFGHGRINVSNALGISQDTLQPLVSILSPANLTRVETINITVTASANDTDSGIAFVDFLINGERVGSATSPPYQASLFAREFKGLNMVSAVAYDKTGNSSIADITMYKQSFMDVAPTYWAFQDIEDLSSSKVLAGYPDGTFKPGNFIGRAEFVKMLVEGLGLSKKSSYSGYFKDVPKSNWAWPYIEAAYDMGLITGYSKDSFGPSYRIKRVEMATILIKTGAFTVDYSGAPFSDVALSYWGYVYVMSARNSGIIDGYPGNVFRPENVMTRAEAAKAINKSNLLN